MYKKQSFKYFLTKKIQIITFLYEKVTNHYSFLQKKLQICYFSEIHTTQMFTLRVQDKLILYCEC